MASEFLNIPQLVNFALALLTLAIGAHSMLWPEAALRALDVEAMEARREARMIRQRAAGGMVGLALFALALGAAWPVAWVMLGALSAGTAFGRLLSFPPQRSDALLVWMSLFFEIGVAAWMIGANWKDATAY